MSVVANKIYFEKDLKTFFLCITHEKLKKKNINVERKQIINMCTVKEICYKKKLYVHEG